MKSKLFDAKEKTGEFGPEDLFSKEVRDRQTRTDQTEAQYLKLFQSLWTRFASHMTEKNARARGVNIEEYLDATGGEGEQGTPGEFIEWFMNNAKAWEYSTIRINRSAVRSRFVEAFYEYPEASKYLQLLDQLGAEDSKTKHRSKAKRSGEQITEELKKKTSGYKKKSIKEANLRSLIDWVSESDLLAKVEQGINKKEKSREPKGIWKLRAALFLIAGTATGLRPIEWVGLQVVEDSEEELILLVNNAKNTNGRAHGETRNISIDSKHPLSEIVRIHIKEFSRFIESGEKSQLAIEYSKKCNAAIKLLEDEIMRKGGPKSVGLSMYSGRHQFSANLKMAGLTVGEIAYLMGHNSGLTAIQHYGKKRVGYSRRKISPLVPDVMTTGELVASNNPMTPKSGLSVKLKDLVPKGPSGPSM